MTKVDPKALIGLLENANVTLPLEINGGDDFGNFWINDAECNVPFSSDRFENAELIVEAINALPELLKELSARRSNDLVRDSKIEHLKKTIDAKNRYILELGGELYNRGCMI